ncbi:MAG TPA: hypothetical protein PLJ27_23020, partial [Polyangiaceae bacterium]|nr:hypothetical protein [Polyangiaceae bacterium]
MATASGEKGETMAENGKLGTDSRRWWLGFFRSCGWDGQAVYVSLIAALFLAFLGCGGESEPADDEDASVGEGSGDELLDAPGETEVLPEGAPPVACKPKSCVQVGATCGSIPDGCGDKVECGTCPAGQFCGGAGPNTCGTERCIPKTCLQLNAQCGWVSDQCGEAIDCGGCAYPQTCGGGGENNECGCTPKTCSQLGVNCGTVLDGCDGTLNCGECDPGQICGGAGPNLCGGADCAAKTCSQLGAACGLISDGCSDVLFCGDCKAPDVCGGGGIANECGCTAKTCSQLGASCGIVDTDCGPLDCGDCKPPNTCGGAGVANQCGCTCSLPNAVTDCFYGECILVSCLPGFDDCDGNPANGCETNLDTDPGHCGTCTHACPTMAHAQSTCQSGNCGFVCQGRFADCDGNASNGCETDLNTDPSHCQQCGNVCPDRAHATTFCAGATCGFQCLSGYGNCDSNASNGCETDLKTSLSHCGTCGKTCSFSNASASCTNGVCALKSCNSGYGNCDNNSENGCEVNLATNKNHCGSCGRACPSGSCVSGTCEYTSADTARKWDQSYLGSGGQYNYNQQNNYQGQYLESNGVLKSAIGAPDKMFTDLAGAQVLDIWVYCYAAHWYWNSGGVARIGVHGHSTKPGTFPGINQTLEVNFGKPEGKWVRLPDSWYASFKSGAYRGITLHAGNS